MSAFARHERAKRAQLDSPTLAYAHSRRDCTDPRPRWMGDAMRSASHHLWTSGGSKNVAASVRAAQLAILAVLPVKLSNGSNAYLYDARLNANGAIGYELGEGDPRIDDIRPLDEVAEAFWYRGDDKHGRAAVAVLGVIERLLTMEVQ